MTRLLECVKKYDMAGLDDVWAHLRTAFGPRLEADLVRTADELEQQL